MNPTLAGFLAICMWALLALFTAASGHVPPFQLLAMTFLIGGLLGVASWPFREGVKQRLKLPARVWAVGIAGLFGYHFFYYTALRNAPVAEASLIAYLWPMLIVVGSALLPGEKLRWFHLAGVACGFTGVVLLVTGKAESLGFSGSWLGYGSALACALIWSSYSILSRSLKSASSDAVAIYCLVTAALSLICHLIFETTVWPANGMQWLAVAGLGLMPVGLAFYIWDYGVKHGNIQLLGTAAYLAPLISTFILVAAGIAPATWQLAAAALLITLGALTASGRLFGRAL
ncbi:MAG: EamA family transporter [Salaquimonas sp.]|jgi:drug/metabolite transporter (DMT)-like permease|nr:EamA family transporter [Salaquimonas sp.]